jgi:hypothetical protein
VRKSLQNLNFTVKSRLQKPQFPRGFSTSRDAEQMETDRMRR